jgi:hypothetical protein
MARASFKYKEGEIFSSLDQSNEEIKEFENFLYDNWGEHYKLRFESDMGIVVIGREVIEKSIFIFNYDEEKEK